MFASFVEALERMLKKSWGRSNGRDGSLGTFSPRALLKTVKHKQNSSGHIEILKSIYCYPAAFMRPFCIYFGRILRVGFGQVLKMFNWVPGVPARIS